MPPDLGKGFFVSGGTLPYDSPSYVERAADHLLFSALSEGRYCYVLNSRQMGKSSLSVHTMGRLEQAGVRTAYLDLTRIGGKNISPEQWYTGLAAELVRSLGLTRELARYWKENAATGPMQRLFGAVRQVMLEPSEGEAPSPLVIFLDEIDATRGLPFDVDEFFAGIRECFNQRVFDASFERLTFCLIGVAVPSDLIRNPATTPFNIGERVPLEDFTLAEMHPFAKALGPEGERLLKRVHYWAGGHPFLSQSICRALSRQSNPPSIEDIDEIARRELFDFKVRASNINLADVANIALHYGDTEPDPGQFRANVLSTYQRMLAGKEVVDDEANRVTVVLKLSGLARTDGRRLLVRNRIYEHVFDRVWIEENMPDQEQRRQRQSYRRGAMRAAAISGGVLLAMGGLALYAWQSRLESVAARTKLDYQLYVADMNSLRTFFEQGDTAKIESILARHRTSEYRGFEWDYWLARFHDAKEEYTLDYEAPGKREEGHISADGRQICIVDALTRTASVIDRASRRLAFVTKLEEGERVLALKDGFATKQEEGQIKFFIRDLRTRKLLSRVEIPEMMISICVSEHSNCAVVPFGKVPEIVGQGFVVWDLKDNRKVWTARAEKDLSHILAISEDGSRVLYQRHTPGTGKFESVVIAIPSGRILDKGELSDQASFLTWANGSDSYVFQTPSGKVFCRDVIKHRQTAVTPPDENPLKTAVCLGNTTLAWQFEGDRCVISDLKDPLNVIRRENVFNLTAGARPGQYLASSTSVRVYETSEPGAGQVVARGRRVTRFAPGLLNVFVDRPNTIRRIDDKTFRTLGELPTVTTGRDYTYNGHWSVIPGLQAQAVSTDSGLSPLNLPFNPAIWAAGPGQDFFALWSQADSRLVMLSPRTGKILWEKNPFRRTQAMWISPDGSRLFIVKNEREVHVYDSADGRELAVLSAHNISPVGISFTADGKGLFTCGGDGRAVLWDVKSLRKRQEFRGNALQTIASADLSPDGRRVATCSRSGAWQLWDASNGVQLMDLPVSKQALSSVLFIENGKKVITAGDDNQVRVWATVDREPTVRIPIDTALLAGVHP